jgi:hypothetical protein
MTNAFTWGYIWAFALEIIWTTVLRLGVFAFLDSDLFEYQPQEQLQRPSLLILPWILRDVKYRPKRITLLLADFLTSCVAAPVIEEFIKLRLLQWNVPLSK